MLNGVEPLNNNSESQPTDLSGESENSSASVKRWQILASALALRLKSVAKSKRFLWGLALSTTATVSVTLGTSFGLFVPLPFVAPEYQMRSLTDVLRKIGVYRLSRPINILVMGIDRVPDAPKDSPAGLNGRSDTMLLVRLDPRDNSVKMLSIPRDTLVDNPFLRIDKINQANTDGGPALAAQVVSSTLDDVQVDRYVRVTTEAFRQLVDMVGGVEVFVPQKMQYVDATQRLKIDLEPGLQTLNGQQAEQFARFRNDENGDIGRVQRQQLLLKALREKVMSPSMLPRLPQLMQEIQKYADTNINWEEILALADFGLKLEKTDIKMVMLPGRFSTPKEYAASYWILDKTGRDRVMHDFFGVDTPEVATDEKSKEDSVRIAIQNASGNPDMSHQVAKYLKSLGFRNTYLVKDWPETQSNTQIIVQKGDLAAAEKLKTALGLGNIDAASTGDIRSDITLRVGEDWTPPNTAKDRKDVGAFSAREQRSRGAGERVN